MICQKEVSTRVEQKVAGEGKAWACVCFCIGGCLLSLLVLCMDGFKEFCHFCPSCNLFVLSYRPEFSGGKRQNIELCLLILLTIGIIAIQIFVLIFYIFPMV